MAERNALFLSHASPEDNAFTIWLGAKLAAFGYEVWADVLRLSGGEDWQRKLESAIRDRAFKVLLAANANAVNKQGVRNELQIASDVAKKIDDKAFVIPLRLGAFDAPFVIAQAQYINFETSWAAGLQELLQTLNDVYKVPCGGSPNLGLWTNLQLLHGKPVTPRSESLISNWLEVRRLPATLRFLPPGAARMHRAALGVYPRVEYGESLLSVQSAGARDQLSIATEEFLQNGWPRLGIGLDEGRRLFTALANQALGQLFELKSLASFPMANRQLSWWLPKGVQDSRVSFRWAGIAGSRQLQGFSARRKVYWHFGVSTAFRSRPFPHVRIKSRLLFSEDGRTPIEKPKRTQRLRKSFAKGWRNARWRDMMLAFLYWIGDGTSVLNVPMADDEDLVLSLPPLAFTSPISITDASVGDEDMDDPEIEFVNDDEGMLDEDEEEGGAETAT
jgi:hypothetical protein